MGAQTATTLKGYFETGDQPTATQFIDVFDSMLNLTDGGTVGGATVLSGANTLSGATSITGVTTLSGAAGIKGAEAVIYASSGVVTTGAVINSGAMTVPAGSIITDMGCVVITQLVVASGNWGHRFGTTAGTVDLAALVVAGLEGSQTTVAVGIGANMIAENTTAMGGASPVVMDVGDPYRASSTAVHGSILSAGGSITGGNVTFWVKYISIV